MVANKNKTARSFRGFKVHKTPFLAVISFPVLFQVMSRQY